MIDATPWRPAGMALPLSGRAIRRPRRYGLQLKGWRLIVSRRTRTSPQFYRNERTPCPMINAMMPNTHQGRFRPKKST